MNKSGQDENKMNKSKGRHWSVLRRISPIFLLLIILSLAGCAGLAAGKNTETLLKERVNTYWQHKVNKEFAEAYLMEVPEYRKNVGMTGYIMANAGGVIWRAVSAESVSILEDHASVQIKMNYALFGTYAPKEGLVREISDCWKFVDAQWYHMLECPKEKPLLQD